MYEKKKKEQYELIVVIHHWIATMKSLDAVNVIGNEQ